MKPTSKIIQVLSINERATILLVLCEDGSLWKIDLMVRKFILIVEFNGKSY